MAQETNQLLEYTIDTLLEKFNPNREPIMKKSHFFKMMDILDSHLKKQGIDIKYPSYWYRYGSVAELDILDQLIPRGFYSRYFMGENIVYPYPRRKSYDVIAKIKNIINSTIESLCAKYRYQPDSIKLLKNDSYKLNSPYDFNTDFQKCFDLIKEFEKPIYTDINEISGDFESLLDILLAEFPETEYQELSDIHLLWDDTTRLILNHVENCDAKHEYLQKITDLFWGLYSKAIRVDYNQNIPKSKVREWETEYESMILPIWGELENIHKQIVVEVNFRTDTNDDLVKEILQKAYDLDT